MIRIHRPDAAPEILRTKGKNKRRGHSVAYSRSPNAFRDGTKSLKFDSGIYGHRTVKQALIDAQHGKCCFCESKIAHIAHGDVEHFRPKAGYRQERDDPLGKPGYYWLAYEWSNLLFACQLCNQRHKRNLFPLRDPTQRAICHRDDISQEQPLLIDPAREDPEASISFRAEVPYALGGDPRGRTTIEALSLDREALNERRRDRLEAVRIISCLAATPSLPGHHEARDYIRRAGLPSAQFASMVRAAIAAGDLGRTP